MAILRLKNSDGSWVDVPEIHGENAYEGAVRNGFTGTEAEFYDQLSHFTTYANQAKDAADRAEEVMDSIPQDYQTLDQHVVDLTEHIVEVSETQPVNEQNKLWIQPTSEEVRVPTYEEFEELRDSVAPIEENSTFSRGYSKGEHFIHDGGLCVTTVDVAQGDTITLGTNCSIVPDGLAGEVTDLESTLDEITVLKLTKISGDIITGKYINAAGAVVDAASGANQWEVTDYIDISEFDSVAITASSYTNRMYYAFYKEDKTYIAGSGKLYEANTILHDEIVSIPVGAKYCVAMWYYTTQVNDPIIKSVSPAINPDGFIQYNPQTLTDTQKTIARYNIGAVDESDIKEISVRKVVGKNKFNPETSVNGYIMNGAGTILPADQYNTTDFIDVSEFSNSVCVSPRLRDALQYDSDFVPIAVTYIGTAQNNAVIAVNENAHYIRVTYYIADEARVQIEDGIEVSTYEPYELIPENDVNCLNPRTKASVEELIDAKGRNVLYGKKWIHFGDSFSAYTNKQFTSGIFSGKDMSYPRLIADRNRMTISESFFMSGRTLAYPEDGTFTNSATCPTNSGYYQNIPEDADYITIMLGINDLNHQSGSGTSEDGEDQTGVITLGTIDDTGTATYYGAWNTVLAWIRENRPFAHVGIIVTNGTQSQEFTEAQIAEAKKWGFSYLNLNGDERTPAFIRCYNPNMPSSLKESLKTIQGVDAPSNTHPNWQTHELESTIIEAWLRTL